MAIKVIFATGMNGEFYNKKTGLMPWGARPLSGDDRQFFNYTRGEVVVMGRNTWDSLPNKLKGRVNVVLSEEGHIEPKRAGMPDYILKGELSQVLPEVQTNHLGKDVIVIGGMNLIRQAIPFADEVSWTTSDFTYPDCECFDLELLRKQLRAARFKFYADTRFNNEGFGLGANCNVKIFKKN